MILNIQALANDMADYENLRLAQEYVPYILNELDMSSKTLEHLYKDDYYDIPLYLALHYLITTNLIWGHDPYSDDGPHDHRLMKYGKVF